MTESPENYEVMTDDLEDAIVNLVITLSQKKAETLGITQAKQQTAQFLSKIIDGLQEEPQS